MRHSIKFKNLDRRVRERKRVIEKKSRKVNKKRKQIKKDTKDFDFFSKINNILPFFKISLLNEF